MTSRTPNTRPLGRLPSDIHADLVETLFGTVESFLAGMLGGMLVPLIGYLRTGEETFIAFAAALLVLSAIRIVALVKHDSTPVAIRRENAAFWEACYAFGGIAFMTGVGITSAYLLLLKHDEITDIYGVSIAVSCAGALAGRNAGRPGIVMGQVAGVCAPVAVAVFLDYHWGLAALLVLLVVSVWSATRFLNEMLVSAMLAGRSARLQREQLTLAMNTMSHGLCMAGPDGRVSVANKRLHDFFGLKIDLDGTLIDELGLTIANASGMDASERAPFLSRLNKLLINRRSASFVGRIGDRQFSFRFEPGPNAGAVIVVEDVTEARQAAEEVERLAHFDDLTSLPNRFQLHAQLQDQLAAMGSTGTEVALLSIDLDRFKEVNDTLGHPTGDKLLRQVAERLLAIVPPSDLVARFGGDEFQICLTRAAGDDDLERLARMVVTALSAPYTIGNHAITIGASVGIAVAPHDATGADDLVKCADMALYAAKAAGRGTFAYFTADMDEAARRRRQLEQELRIALATNQLEVHYQPIVDAPTGAVAACEALVRWKHPKRGMVPPDEFIKAAEETGIIVELGRYVLKQACLDALTWPSHIRLAVNVSPKQFSLMQDFVEHTTALLGEIGFPYDRLEFEITEGTLMEYKAPLAELSALGIRISLDDFGTGYSSLSYLQQFKVDKIKIDRSFTRSLDNKVSLAVIEAISALARSLEVELVVEGVETSGQLLLLTKRNVRLIQGYIYSRPVPAEMLSKMLVGSFDIGEKPPIRHVA